MDEEYVTTLELVMLLFSWDDLKLEIFFDLFAKLIPHGRLNVRVVPIFLAQEDMRRRRWEMHHRLDQAGNRLKETVNFYFFNLFLEIDFMEVLWLKWYAWD